MRIHSSRPGSISSRPCRSRIVGENGASCRVSSAVTIRPPMPSGTGSPTCLCEAIPAVRREIEGTPAITAAVAVATPAAATTTIITGTVTTRERIARNRLRGGQMPIARPQSRIGRSFTTAGHRSRKQMEDSRARNGGAKPKESPGTKTITGGALSVHDHSVVDCLYPLFSGLFHGKCS